MANELRLDREDDIGPWSELKLDVVGKYLPAYTTIMARQRDWCHGGFHYLDAFAGTGRPRARNEDRYVKGSPRIALDLDHPFDSYTFVEKAPWRARCLRELRDEYPHRRIDVVEADCNDVVLNRFVPWVVARRPARGFIFLDPFGMQLRWETIEAIARTRALEVVLNFPTMALTRGALRSGIGTLTEDLAAQATALWGSEGWRRLFYEQLVVDGDRRVEVRRSPITAEQLARAFVEDRLRTEFRYVTDPLIVSNGRGVPIYALIFAGHNETGARIARHVFNPPEPTPLPLPLVWADAS